MFNCQSLARQRKCMAIRLENSSSFPAQLRRQKSNPQQWEVGAQWIPSLGNLTLVMGIHEASTKHPRCLSSSFCPYENGSNQNGWQLASEWIGHDAERRWIVDMLWWFSIENLLDSYCFPLKSIGFYRFPIGFLSQDAGFQFLFVWICVWHLKRWNGAPVGSPKHRKHQAFGWGRCLWCCRCWWWSWSWCCLMMPNWIDLGMPVCHECCSYKHMESRWFFNFFPLNPLNLSIHQGFSHTCLKRCIKDVLIPPLFLGIFPVFSSWIHEKNVASLKEVIPENSHRLQLPQPWSHR